MCHSHCLCIRSTAFREECVNVHLDRRSIETSFELLQRDRGMKQLGNLLHIHRLGCRAGRSRGAHQANTRPCVPSSFTTHRTLSCEPFLSRVNVNASLKLATWCVRKLRGDARPSPYRVPSVAPGRRVWCARRRRMVMNVAASAPVRRGFSGQERDADAFGEGVGVLSVARSDEAGAGGAVVGCVVRAAGLLEAEHELAELLFRASKGVDVTLGGGGGGRSCALSRGQVRLSGCTRCTP